MSQQPPPVSPDRARSESAAVSGITPAARSLMASVGHAIRTPLSGIIGAASLIQVADLPPEQHRNVQLLRRSADNLLVLMSDVLDVFRLESGELKPRADTFTTRELVAELSSALRQRDEEADAEVAIDDGELPSRQLRTDGRRVARSLAALIALCRGLATRGGVGVTLRLEQSDESRAEFCAEVCVEGLRDTHANPADLCRRVNTFAGAEGAGDDAPLDVWLAAKLIEGMGGRGEFTLIDSKSTDEQAPALKLHVHLPVEVLPGSGMEADPDAAHKPVFNGQILVAMPKGEGASLLHNCLSGVGFDVVCVERGEEAIKTLLNAATMGQPITAVFTDESLKDMSGSALLKLMRSLPATRHTLVCGVGTGGLDELDCYLAKPLRQADILECVHAYFSQGKAGGGAKNRVTAVRERLPEIVDGNLPRVLIAEDHPVNRTIVRAMLTKLGCEVDEARNGDEAVRKILDGELDLVLMDCDMPLVDGLEATRRVRESMSANAHVPIIALTGHDHDSMQEACTEAGMNDHLTKPATPKQLQEMLDLWVDSKATVRVPESTKRNREEAKQRRARERKLVAESRDTDGLVVDRGLLGEFEKLTSRDIVQRSLEDFISFAEADVEELLGAIAKKDSAALLRGAQRLGGAAATIGAHELRETCKTLEEAARAEQQALFSEALSKVRDGLSTLELGLRDAGYLQGGA